RWLVIIPLLQALSLWTYEPGVVLVLFAPAVLISWRSEWRRAVGFSIVWLMIPAFYVASLAQRYLISAETSYQSNRLATHFTLGERARVLGGLMWSGLAFWVWPRYWLTAVIPDGAGVVMLPTAGPLTRRE